MKTHKILLGKICFKFRYNRSFNVFLMFLSFWHGLFLLVVVLILLKIFMSIAFKIVLKAVSAIKNTAGQYFFNLR
ncbi:hypothetical protein D2C75_03365 [Helicobacter pylori]|nr:hypothetical protein D2C75_03365 [Helicobacter pylori]